MQSRILSEAWSASTHLLADRLLIHDWSDALPWRDAVPQSLANERHLLPVVLELNHLDEMQRQEIWMYLTDASHAKAPPAMLIGSDLSAEALARHLARHVTVTLADDSCALLRFADPTVFVQLLWILPLPLLASLCDGVSYWSMPFREQWLDLAFKSRPEMAWNRLGEAQSVALVNVGLINDALATLPEVREVKELWRCSQEINEWLRTAQDEFGLTSADDCVAFARHGALLGSGFNHHPKLASHLRAARAMPGRYAHETAQLSEDEWNTVISEIERNNREREAS